MRKLFLLLFLIPVIAKSQTITVTSDGRLQANCPVCPPPVVIRDTVTKTVTIRDTIRITNTVTVRDTIRITNTVVIRDTIRLNCDTTTVPPPPVTGTTTPLSFTQLTTDYSRPGSGAEWWNNTYQITIPNVDSRDVYYRFTWNQFEKGNGQYDFADLDQQIKWAVDAGRKFSFGIMTQYVSAQAGWTGIVTYDGATSAYPQYIHQQSGSDWKINGGWFPNYNSEAYLSGWERLNKAIYNHLNTATYKGYKMKDVIGYIDIRGYGEFGEWHNYFFNNIPAAVQPTETTLIRIIDAVKNGIPDIRLVVMSDGFVTDGNTYVTPKVVHHMLTASNQAGEFGWRRDNWGSQYSYSGKLENNPLSYNGIQLKDLIINKWKVAPIVGEPCCNSGYNNLPADITKYHATSFGNGNYGSVTASNVIAASKAAGYRLTLTSGSVTTNKGALSVTLNWQNNGIAPVYEQFIVTYELRQGNNVVKALNSTFSPVLFMGTKAITDSFTGLPSGNYDLYLVIKNNYRNLPLGITGNSNGYLLKSGIIL